MAAPGAGVAELHIAAVLCFARTARAGDLSQGGRELTATDSHWLSVSAPFEQRALSPLTEVTGTARSNSAQPPQPPAPRIDVVWRGSGY